MVVFNTKPVYLIVVLLQLSGRKNPDELEHAVLRSRDDRLPKVAFLHADPVSIPPLLKTTFILVGSDKKQIAVTSLWNRSLDTMGKRLEGNNRLVAVPLARPYHTPIFSSFFGFCRRSTGQHRVGRL